MWGSKFIGKYLWTVVSFKPLQCLVEAAVFRSFHISSRSGIFTNAVDICLFVNIVLS